MYPTDTAPFIVTITANGAGEQATVSVQGALDDETARALETCLEPLHAFGCRRIVLDLAGVPFVDAAGLTLLFHTAKDAQFRGQEVVLRHANHRLLRLLEITRLALAFGIERSFDQVA